MFYTLTSYLDAIKAATSKAIGGLFQTLVFLSFVLGARTILGALWRLVAVIGIAYVASVFCSGLGAIAGF